ncbi:MAG: toll/interleukin-1 receptor domain-containing protein [Solobacterium sp.]|nr:toll/interleukin-1 receptor domain-containing protein [Solobacterium sp.]
MIDHYNAFISYRHVPRDISVAEEVQRQLERFPIPAAIRKSTGISKIERIFRDKDELPISANLSDDIDYALKHSDFLIVICSPAVLESRWVEREIELFLETHTEQQVLTVLSEGDPSEAIPPRLLQRRETVTLEDGSKQEVMVQAEPLSCDYRLPFREARKKELPRLAAVMLGCSYDELVNRARQYRNRRIAALASVLFVAGAAAVGWLLYSNARISENLRQAYINQSHYLASESMKALDDQDRILAAQLALAALPKEGEDRPVIAEAEFALGTAVGAFTTPGSTEFSAVRRYENGTDIRDFIVSPDRSTIAQFDADYKLSVIDIASGDVLGTKQFDNEIKLLKVYDKGVLIDGTNYTAMLDWQNAQPVWENKTDHFTWNLTLSQDTDQYIACNRTDVYAVDCLTGKEIWSLPLPEIEEKYEPEIAMLYSGGKAAVMAEDSEHFLSRKQIMYLSEDPAERTYVKLPFDFYDVLHVCENSDGNLVVTDRLAGEDETSGLFEAMFLYESFMRFRCFDLTTGETLWDIRVPYTLYGYEDVRRQVYKDAEGVQHNGLVCTEANVQAVVDIDAGVLFKRVEWPGEVVNIYSCDERMFHSLLADGRIAMLYFYEDMSACRKYFTDDLLKGHLCANKESGDTGMLVLPDGENYLVRYQMDMYDTDYHEFPDIELGSTPNAIVEGDTAVFFGSVPGEDTVRIIVYDLVQEKVRFTYDLPDHSHYGIETMALTPDRRHAYIFDDQYSSSEAVVVGLQEESVETFAIKPAKNDINWQMYDLSASGTVSWLGLRDRHFVYGKWQYGGEAQERVYGETGMYPQKLHVSPAGTEALVVLQVTGRDAPESRLMNLEDGTTVKLRNITDKDDYWTAWSADSTMAAVSGEGFIRIYDKQGRQLTEIETDTQHLCDMEFMDGALYAAYSDGRLIRWSLSGEKERQYDFWIYTNTRKQDFDWTREGNTLYLGAGRLMNILQLDQNQSSLYITEALAMDYAGRRVIVYRSDSVGGTSGYKAGCFPLYTTEELIAKGQALTAGTTMSDQQKQTYGLD